MSINSGHKLSEKKRTIMVYISCSLPAAPQTPLKGLTNDCLVASVDALVVRVDPEEARSGHGNDETKDDSNEGGAGSVALGMKSPMNFS